MTSRSKNRILFLGFGNPGRLDDGLGPLFIERFGETAPEGTVLESDYQLNVEYAAALAESEVAVFVDASTAAEEPFELSAVECESSGSFSSHSVSPSALLSLAKELFGSSPQGYLLAIRGYEFNEFGERLSEGAERNLQLALRFARRLAEAAIRGERKTLIHDLKCGEASL